MDAARAIACGEGELYIACWCGEYDPGRRSSLWVRATHAYSRNAEVHDSTIGWRFVNKKLTDLYHPYSMGEGTGGSRM